MRTTAPVPARSYGQVVRLHQLAATTSHPLQPSPCLREVKDVSISPESRPATPPRVGANGIVRRRADTKRADLTDGSNCDARSARTLRRMASPPRPRDAKCPLLVSDVLLSHGLLRSTIGARGLNFRVRNGTGCASPAMVADQQGAFCCQGRLRAVPWGPHSVTSGLPRRSLELGMKRRARPISTARLNPSRGLHLRPIELVVYEWPYRRENSSRDWLPA